MASLSVKSVPFRVLPVLDVRGGRCVRANGGSRDQYPPLAWPNAQSNDPADVAIALQAAFGTTELYAADLDAIMHGTPNLDDWQSEVATEGFRLWLDAGVRTARDAERVRRYASRVIVGTESLASMAAWGDIVRAVPPEQLVLSFDLVADQPRLGWGDQRPAWDVLRELLDVAAERRDASPSAVILLDLARIGQRSGASGGTLFAKLRAERPDLDVLLAGGVRDGGDLQRLAASGVAGALVGAALYSGILIQADFIAVGCVDDASK